MVVVTSVGVPKIPVELAEVVPRVVGFFTEVVPSDILAAEVVPSVVIL